MTKTDWVSVASWYVFLLCGGVFYYFDMWGELFFGVFLALWIITVNVAKIAEKV